MKDSAVAREWLAASAHTANAKDYAAHMDLISRKVQVMTPGRVMFKTVETVEANDGTVQAHGVEIILEKETDGKWRVVQERILSREEAEHDGLWQ